MSANHMDYFEQKPDLDLKAFFEAKGMKMDSTPVSGYAPPPKDTAWVAQPETPTEEE
jgi:hypothetical protein